MSTIAKYLPKPPDGFSTQIASATVASDGLSIQLDSATGLPTEGIGQLFKKDATGDIVSGSVEFIHWTNVAGTTITMTDTGDRGITGSDSGAQAYVADDYFEIWVSSYYVDGADVEHNDDGTHGVVTATSVDLGSSIAVTGTLDEDDMASDSAVKVATQQSIKAYSDNDGIGMARQAIMNGNFDIWQRGTSFTPTSGDLMADRWKSAYGVDGGTNPTDTVTRQAQTPGALPNSYYFNRLTVDGAGSGFGSDAYYDVLQRIEYGTRNLAGASKTVTVSFYARSDITNKKLGLYMRQYYGSGGTPTTTEVINGEAWTLTSSWVKYTHTFTTNTLASKTFGTSNNDYLEIRFAYMWGDAKDDEVGETTAEDFVGAGDIDIARVQVCVGDVALPFQPKSYAQELAACQRYFISISGSPRSQFGYGYVLTDTTAAFTVPTPVPMRDVTPTISYLDGAVGELKVSSNGVSPVITGLSTTNGDFDFASGVPGIGFYATGATGLTANHAAVLRGDNTNPVNIGLDAEL